MRRLIVRGDLLQSLCSSAGRDEPRKTILQLQYLQVLIQLHLGIYLGIQTAVFRGAHGIPRPQPVECGNACKNCQLLSKGKRTNQLAASVRHDDLRGDVAGLNNTVVEVALRAVCDEIQRTKRTCKGHNELPI